MRVVAGTARGHKLTAPDGLQVRPTADKVKEAVFSILAQDIYGADFLDVFSGSGAIGIEALSRGCRFCTFVEAAMDNCAVINSNLMHVSKAIGQGNYKVMQKPALDALMDFAKSGARFDIIFMDPPYNKGLAEPVMETVCKYGLLKAGGCMVLEMEITEKIPEIEGVNAFKVKKYGKTMVCFFEVTGD